MKNIFILFAMVFFLSSSMVAQERVLSNTEKVLGLSRLWEGVRSNYVYYDKLQLDWDSLYESSIPKILEIQDTYTYLKELQRIVAYTQDGHTYIYFNTDLIGEDRIIPLPFTTKLVGNSVFVDKILSSELIDKGIVRGAKVISINNIDVFTYARKELGQYVPSSTSQWLYYKTMNRFYLTMGEKSEPITVEFVNNGKNFSISYPNRIIKRDIQVGITWNKSEPFEFKLLDNNIGLLKINHFNDNEFNRKFDTIYSSILSTEGLIIDLRDNGGGNSSYADYILRHLSKTPIKTSSWSSRMYIPAHVSWGYADECIQWLLGIWNLLERKYLLNRLPY